MLNKILDKSRRPPDYILLTIVGILVPIGLVMVYSASFMDAIKTHEGNPFYYTQRQIIGALIGVGLLAVTMRIDYRFWRKVSLPLMLIAIALLLITLVLPEINGTRQWIVIGPLSFQPSEFAKLAVIVYLAGWLSNRGENVSNVTRGLIPFGVVMGVICGLVAIGGDLGTMIVIVLIGVAVYFAAGASLIHIGGAGLLGGLAGWLLIQVASYRVARIRVWLDGPFADFAGGGYQPAHALFALATGQWLGVGLGQGRQKFLWLPQAHTDAIFAIIGEELGLVGTLAIVGCFLIIAYRGYRIAARAEDAYASLLAIGLTSWLVFQAAVNFAVVTTLLPFTGLTLPFISYGSSSLMMCMAAAGILLNISKHTNELAEAPRYDKEPGRTGRTAPPDAATVWRRNWRARLSGAGSRRSTAPTGRSRTVGRR